MKNRLAENGVTLRRGLNWIVRVFRVVLRPVVLGWIVILATAALNTLSSLFTCGGTYLAEIAVSIAVVTNRSDVNRESAISTTTYTSLEHKESFVSYLGA